MPNVSSSSSSPSPPLSPPLPSETDLPSSHPFLHLPSCHKNPSPYACPRCNIPYCSLTCYQSPSKHSQCSEPFFKEEIETEIGAQRGRTKEEKNGMWELLRKFEEGVGKEGMLDLEEEGLGEQEEEVDGEGDDEEGLRELHEALEGIDIGE